ncbi:MAG: type II toxin-antitoxin system VapC family toxin [bacterium]|nr:type II toxin-antitoxin system VapC family toxin [bacterium]
MILIHYFDASALVKRYVEEPGSEAVRTLLAHGIAATSRITEVEVASALSRRCREGDFSESERDRALATLDRDCLSLYLVELTPEVVAKSHGLLTRHILRAADAIQLASCLEFQQQLGLPAGLVAYDERLLAAARREGLETRGGLPASGGEEAQPLS